jgi:molybdopterin-guanine dinucleotide biosynthesis protein A
MHMTSDSITGAVLAGGHSSRMGRNKALIRVGGKPMIQTIANTMCQLFAEVVVVADQCGLYQFLNLPIIHDIHKNLGPIGGIHAALTELDTPAAFIVGCDTPFVSTEIVEYIVNYPAEAPVKAALVDTTIQPLCALYRRDCLPVINDQISRGTRKLSDLLNSLHTAVVPITPDLPLYRPHLLQNINDPESLQGLDSKED